jgi:hypothetical protein
MRDVLIYCADYKCDAMTAPKTIVTDATGMPIGVKVVAS